MAFTPKSWKNNEEGGTPLSAAAIIDLEERLAGYTDSQVSGAADDLSAHEAATTDVHGISDTSDIIMEGDARLSDARTPVPHAASHAAGQPDAITPAAIGAVPLADLGVVVVRDHQAARPAAGLVLWVVDEEPVNAIAGDQVIGWEPT